jgi:L-alanine-DL-glutamate epimerase-like enolase superfamily enzyme
MKVVSVKTTLFKEPVEWPDDKSGNRLALLELVTDEGIRGLSIVQPEAVGAVNALVKEVLSGTDPRAAMGHWQRMNNVVSESDDPGAARAAAALDIAMWDLKSKVNAEPLWKTLGGSRPRAKAHLSWDMRADAGIMLKWFQRMAAQSGIRCGSMPSSGNPSEDFGRMAELQATLRATVPQSALMLHFDGSGCADDAIRHVQHLESRFDITWVRSPVPSADVAGARLVADSVTAAVCIGRGFSGIDAYRPYLRQSAGYVFELDVALLGISGTVLMADAAFGFEIPVTLTSYAGHLPVQLFSALPTVMSVEIGYRAAASSVCSSDVSLNEDRALAGDLPGNGLSIDRSALAESHSGESP